VYVSWVVDLPAEITSLVRRLLALENEKVVVGRVPPRVAFGPYGRTENDKVLGDRSVQDEHGAHSAPCIIEDPFSTVLEIGSEARLRVVGHKVVNKRLDEDGGVLRRADLGGLSSCQGVFDSLVQLRRLENVESVLSLVPAQGGERVDVR